MGARYEVSYADIENVVDCSKLNADIDNLMVFLKMTEVFNRDLSEKRRREYVLTWAWDLMVNNDINGIGGWFDDIDDDTHDSIEKQLDEIVKKTEQVLLDFKTKTDVVVYWDYDYDKENIVFELNWNDIVQYTPKATMLDNMGVNFYLATTEDE
jgi:hypothetical protein